MKINYNLNDIDINKIEEYIKANNININELLTSLNNYYESFKTFNGPTQPAMELIKTKTLNISHKNKL